MPDDDERPCLAVIFTSRLSAETDGYAEAADRMAELAAAQPGYLGIESARGDDGLGITVSYWRDEESVAAWRRSLEHLAVQDKGRGQWYSWYTVRVSRVFRSYRFTAAGTAGPDGAAAAASR